MQSGMVKKNMKKIVILSLSLIGLTMMSFKSGENANEKNLDINFEKTHTVSGSIYVAIGTYLWSGCQGNNPCGPCSGICIRAGKRPKKVDEMFVIGSPVPVGEGVFNIIDISSNTITLEFLTPGFTNGTQTGLSDNFELGSEIASSYGYSNIILNQGFYDVNFTNSQYGKSTFNITLVP